MKYVDFFKYLFESENNSPKGKEGEDWVRPGSDLSPGMEIGSTNFPHGSGYPNYKPKYSDDEDFEEVTRLDSVVDVPDEHAEQDTEKRKKALYAYIKNKQPEYYQKYREEIDELYKKYVEDYSMIHWLPQDETKEEAQITLTIRKVYSQLFSLIHHRSDAHNELNYPLHVSLYDVTRAFGGYEEGGWWYDKYELIDSIEIHNPSQRIPAAEELYSKIGKNMDGRPKIYIEKEKGSQEKEPPTWS